VLVCTSFSPNHKKSPTTSEASKRILRDIFETEGGRVLLMNFLLKEMSAENLYFLEAHKGWEESHERFSQEDREKMANEIYENYIRIGAPKQVNISDEMRKKIKGRIDAKDYRKKLFFNASSEVMDLMQRDSILRFRKTEQCQKFIEETHGNDEDFVVRSCDPRMYGRTWLLSRPKVMGTIALGDTLHVWTSLSTQKPCLLLPHTPLANFWARSLLPTKAVVVIPARIAKKKACLWGLVELLKEETIKRASWVAQSLNKSMHRRTAKTMVQHFHDSISIADRMRCPFLPVTLAKYYIENLQCPIGLEALFVVLFDEGMKKLSKWSERFHNKDLKIFTFNPDWADESDPTIGTTPLNVEVLKLYLQKLRIEKRIRKSEAETIRNKLLERMKNLNPDIKPKETHQSAESSGVGGIDKDNIMGGGAAPSKEEHNKTGLD